MAVNNIDFSVPPGEIFSFLGPNGAGKTTTINILCTLSKSTSGQAVIKGFDVVRQQNQVRQSIELIFRDPSLEERLSGMQNLRFHALVYNVPASIISVKTADDARAAEEIKLGYGVETRHNSDGLTFEVDNGGEFIPPFVQKFGTKILSVSLRRPCLDDVFLKLTGREIRQEAVSSTFKAMVRQHGRRMRR